MRKILLFTILLASKSITYSQTFGSIDNTFNSGSGTDDIVEAIAIQSNGKILVAGGFSSYNGNATGQVIRLNTDGSHDNTFITSVTGQVRCLAIQNDGKIIIGGGFSHVNGTLAQRIARLNTDGSLDNTFSTGIGAFGGTVSEVSVLFDGSIVAVGSFTLFNDVTVSNIVKLNSNGSLANGSYGTNNLGSIYDMVVQPNGKILICGQFTQYNSDTRNQIARLNADLTLDASFDPGTGSNGVVLSMAIQNDGKIIAGGFFSNFNGASKKDVARLNSDGSVDNSFDAGTGQIGEEVNVIKLTNNEKLVIGGEFSSFNGVSMNNLVVLNNDGSIDSSFDPGNGPNDVIYSISIQNDDKILIGGDFTSYNGTARTGITRLNGEATSNISLLDNVEQIHLQPNPTNGIMKVTVKEPTSAFITASNGAILSTLELKGETTIDISTFTPGVYFIRTAEGQTVKFVKE